MSSSKPCPCLAVTHEDGAEIIVWDAKGTPRTYIYRGNPKNLCFHSHPGSELAEEEAYNFSPNFDSDGLHHDPEESCGCGVTTPHLHMHMHNEEETSGSSNLETDDNWTSVTLHAKKKNPEKDKATVVPCSGPCYSACNTEEPSCRIVQHDQTDGQEQLILENDCDACGESCGRFPLVGERKLDNNVQVHFFEAKIDKKPFHLGECFKCSFNAGIFDTKSNRTQMVIKENSNENTSPSRVIRAKDCSRENSGYFDTNGVQLPPLSSEMAKLVRFELDNCCTEENKIFLAEQKKVKKSDDNSTYISTGPHKLHHEKKSGVSEQAQCENGNCCSSEKDSKDSCCSSEKMNHDSDLKQDHHGHGKHPSSKGDCCSSEKKSSCCSSEKKSSCCSSEKKSSCFSSEKKSPCCSSSKHHDSYHNNDPHQVHSEHPHTKGGCCSSEKNFNENKTTHQKHASKDVSNNFRGITSKCTSSCSRTASTITDLDNDSIDQWFPSNDNSVRSVIDCTQICCAAEIPAINKVLDPQDGIVKVLINIPNKCVLVDHDPSTIAAQDIVSILNKAHFGAALKRDGGSTSTSTVGRSQLLVKGICCASEIPSVNHVLVPLKGVSKTSFNIQNKLVFVDHDTQVVSAQHLCDALNEKFFGASIHHDAHDDQTETLSTFVRSSIAVIDGILPPTEKLKVFMSSFSEREIESFVADTSENKVHIVHNPLVLPIDDIVSSLQESTKSLELSVEVDGASNVDWEFPDVEEDEDTRERVQSLPKVAVMLSGLFWILSMLSYIGDNWEFLKYLALISVSMGLPSIGVKAVARLRSLQFDTNVLVCSAVIGALALQEFAEAAAVTFLFSVSDWLESRATTRARNALSEIVRLRPSKATIFHPVTKELIVVPASAVPVGALVSAKAGAQIPCDGIIVGGKSVVDESSLTGESRPVKKGLKDKVNGGTINTGLTELLIRTTSTAENSAVSRLIRLVEEAQSNRSETEKTVDAFAKKYTPVVIGCAVLMVSLPWFWGRDIGKRWTETGLILIVVACPCALIISTPVTYVAGLAATAQRGILVKGGAYLEALGKVKKIAFDKTGTLTKGQFALLHLKCFGDSLTREEILGYLALIEERASHPIAKAIVSAVKNEGVTIPKNVPLKNLTELEGKGVTAMAGDVRLYVGNPRLFQHIGFDIPEASLEDAESWAKLGGTVGYLGVEGHGVVCAYCCADSPREESAGILQTLKDEGIEVVMLTGDNRDASLLIGAQIGLNESDIKYELLPEDKLTIIGDMMKSRSDVGMMSSFFKAEELVMMCGDGVNDAPALAKASIGVAMGEGAALAMETSDMTLLDSNLEKLLYSIKMGKAVRGKIRENIIFSFATKAVVVGLTLAGYSFLWAAISVDVGSMLIVTLNGMRLLPSRKDMSSTRIGYNEPTTTEAIKSGQV